MKLEVEFEIERLRRSLHQADRTALQQYADWLISKYLKALGELRWSAQECHFWFWCAVLMFGVAAIEFVLLIVV